MVIDPQSKEDRYAIRQAVIRAILDDLQDPMAKKASVSRGVAELLDTEEFGTSRDGYHYVADAVEKAVLMIASHYNTEKGAEDAGWEDGRRADQE